MSPWFPRLFMTRNWVLGRVESELGMLRVELLAERGSEEVEELFRFACV